MSGCERVRVGKIVQRDADAASPSRRFCPPSYVAPLSQALRLAWALGARRARRRAEPCVAQRADAVDEHWDWLPAIDAAVHRITSYSVGPLVRTQIPHACGEEAMRMRPIYSNGCVFGPRVARSSSIPR